MATPDELEAAKPAQKELARSAIQNMTAEQRAGAVMVLKLAKLNTSVVGDKRSNQIFRELLPEFDTPAQPK